MSKVTLNEDINNYNGEVEIIIRDVKGNIVSQHREKNIVKIFAKEILAHRLPYSKVWDPTAGSGAGDWVQSGIDIDEYAAKYIVFGASYDQNGVPLDVADERYYSLDSVSGGYIPITLYSGADYDGGLINAIPLSEPDRPLKRVERIYFEPSYQPAGTPLLQDDVRALNNVLVLETTLTKDEYNGFGTTSSTYFTLTEVALVGAAEVGSVGQCECTPREYFLTGENGLPLPAVSNGTQTINLSLSVLDPDVIREGDQIKIVASGSTDPSDTLGQLNPYYLVLDKSVGGRDITLDRIPVDSDNQPIVGDIAIYRDGFRIFSHRILRVPVKKSEDYVITLRWRIKMA